MEDIYNDIIQAQLKKYYIQKFGELNVKKLTVGKGKMDCCLSFEFPEKMLRIDADIAEDILEMMKSIISLMFMDEQFALIMYNVIFSTSVQLSEAIFGDAEKSFIDDHKPQDN